MSTVAAGPPAVQMPPALLTVKAVAGLLGCSTRNVFRLVDAGKMPPPIRLGRLLRWQCATIDEWISAGCQLCRPAGRA
jgi:excisionase family DNA binding protein